jgi:hypothetical protein
LGLPAFNSKELYARNTSLFPSKPQTKVGMLVGFISKILTLLCASIHAIHLSTRMSGILFPRVKKLLKPLNYWIDC